MTVLKSLKKSVAPDGKSSQRPEALTDADYDHEIQLVDHSSSPRPTSQAPSNVISERDYVSREPTPNSRTPLRKSDSLRKEVAHRNASNYKKSTEDQAPHLGGQISTPRTPSSVHSPLFIPATKVADKRSDTPKRSGGDDAADDEDRGRRRSRSYGATKLHKKEKHEGSESHIDILYENQRGCFLCGIPFFSASALGNLDPAPWTNEFHKPSATGIENAQVPNPSWQWSWKEWKVNHGDGDDPEGFQYSFMFAKMFSWHGPSWWNSFVRRRAWIRKRVKKHGKRHVQESHMLNAEYFTIHPKRSMSRSSRGSSRTYSIPALAKQEMAQDAEKEDIVNIVQLMEVLKNCRIDREKYEAVENFVQHGGEDLYYLQEKMHDIMAQFIFQVSRRILLAHLLQICDEAIEHRKQHQGLGKEEHEEEKRRIDNLVAAIKHAEEEVQRLEFWSDVKRVVENGESLTAVDGSKDWGHGWEGLDNSGPKDVITQRKRDTDVTDREKVEPGVSWTSDLEKGEMPAEENDTSSAEKGKGKAAE